MDRASFLKTSLAVSAGLPFSWGFVRHFSNTEQASPLTFDSWTKLGGPIGGLGYNVRYRFDDPDRLFVTDAWTGLQKSTDGGSNWSDANNGIGFRQGPSKDAIPVFALKIDPNDDDTMWAGLEFGGGLYKSTDGGNNWSKKDNGIDLDPSPDTSPLTIRHIEITPGNSNSVYVMGETHTGEWGNEFERVNGFVYHSSDGGETFSLLAEFNSLTRWLFINPANTNQLLLATGIFDREANTDDPDQGYASGSGLGMYRSEDGGITWLPSNQGISESKSMFMGGADRDPANSGTVIVATGNNNDYNKGTYGAVYRSTDFGSTWTDVTPTLFYDAEPFTAVAFAPSDSSIVYVGSAQAIYRSTNNGLSWTRYGGNTGAPYGPLGIRSGVPIDMVVHPDDPNVVYVNNYGGGVFKSEDGGKNWVSWSKGYSGADIHSIAVDPNDSSKILANGRSGIFKSDDAGENWSGISYGYAAFPEGFGSVFDPADVTGKTLLCSDEHESYVLRSEDGGLNWTPVLYLETGEVGNRHGARTLSFAPSNPSIVYAGFMAAGFHADPHELDFAESKGVYRSEDGGKTWQEINTGLPSGAQARNVTDIAISHQDPNRVYITLREGGIYKTTDGGQTWIDANGTLPAGERWTDVWQEDDPIPRNSLLTVAVHPEDDQTILVGCNSFGIYQSQNGGASWSQILTPQRLIQEGTRDHGHITSIVIDPIEPSNIYASEWHGGVYHSPDNGSSWNVINEMLSTRSVAMLQISSKAEYLYAATQGEGVFRTQLREVGTSNEDVTLDVPTSYSLDQNFPNPFNPTTSITYSLPQSAVVSLKIYDITGKYITTLVDGVNSAGIHTVTFDAGSLSSGMYVYTLETDGFRQSRQMMLVK